MEDIKSSYKKNFIISVICRFDFSPILALQEKISSEYQESIRREFPKFSSVDLVQHRFQINNIGSNKEEQSLQREYSKQWSFADTDNTMKVSITYDSFTFECFKYTTFEDFSRILNHVYNQFLSIYNPVVCTRFGLRYINKIVFPQGHPLEWSSFIVPSISGIIEDFPNKELLSRAMSQFIFKKDEYQIIVNFGIANPDYPGVISKKEYLLDFDCFTEYCDGQNPIVFLTTFHDEIQELFEQIITDSLRKELGVINEG